MDKQEVREIVKITLEELIKSKLIVTDSYKYILGVVESRLQRFFNNTNKSDPELHSILKQLSDDEYIDVIFLLYRDNVTIERVAEIFDRDISTIKRNKKRLIKLIYEALEEG